MSVAGLRGTGDWGADERPTSFREKIMFIAPNGTSPIFALTAKARTQPLDDPKHTWWAEMQSTVAVKINQAGGYNATDTLFTVDSTDPSASAFASRYGQATHLKPGDLLLVKPAADSATYDHEIVQVVSVLSATQFTVTRGAGSTTAAAIADDLELLLIGSAYAEGTGAPQAVSRNPVSFFNLCQIFKDTYELTKTTDATKARTGDAWSNDKKRKAFDHARNIEMALLFGQRSETTGANGKPLRTMGGLRSYIPASNTTVFGAAVTVSSFLDAVSPAFDFDTPAGNTRLGFAGNTAIMELNKVFLGSSEVRINYDKKLSVYGLDLVEIILPRGRILFYSHPLLNQDPLYQSAMFLTDFSALVWHPLRGRDTKPFDDVQAKDEDVRRGYFMTEGCISVDCGGVTQAYLGNISAT